MEIASLLNGLSKTSKVNGFTRTKVGGLSMNSKINGLTYKLGDYFTFLVTFTYNSKFSMSILKLNV